MYAMQFTAYGSSERLKSAQIPIPVPLSNQIQVRVAATSINPIDWKLHSGMLRWIKPVRFPSIPCFDFAGIVSAVGNEVTDWVEGDRIFGMLPMIGQGAAAEYVAVDEKSASRVPTGLQFPVMAGLPLAGMTALQALRDQGQLKSGQQLLVVGGSGGVGHYAIQIGHLLGALVTAISSGRNTDFCKNLGASTVLDYTASGFSAPPAAFDLILDCAGQESFSQWEPAMKPTGRYVTLLPSLLTGLAALRLRLMSKQRVMLTFVKPARADLEWLAEQVQQGRLETTIDSIFPLADLATAMQKSRLGHARGKIIITCDQ